MHEVTEEDVGKAVTVEVFDQAAASPLGGETLDRRRSRVQAAQKREGCPQLPLLGKERTKSRLTSPVDQGIGIVDAVVVLREEQVQLSVQIQVPAVDRLDSTAMGNIQIRAGVTRTTLPQLLESLQPDHYRLRHHRVGRKDYDESNQDECQETHERSLFPILAHSYPEEELLSVSL